MQNDSNNGVINIQLIAQNNSKIKELKGQSGIQIYFQNFANFYLLFQNLPIIFLSKMFILTLKQLISYNYFVHLLKRLQLKTKKKNISFQIIFTSFVQNLIHFNYFETTFQLQNNIFSKNFFRKIKIIFLFTKMNIRQEYRLFLLQNKIRQTTKSLWIFHYIIPVMHMTFLVILATLKTSFQLEGSLYFLRQFLRTVQQNYLTARMAEIYMLIGNVIYILALICSIIRLIIIPNLDEINKHKKFEKALFIMTVFLQYCSQIIIYFIAWSFGGILEMEGFLTALLYFVLPSCSYTYYTYKYQTVSLYDFMTIPIVLSVSLIPSVVSYLLVGVGSIYMIAKQKFVAKKICYSLVLFFVLVLIKNLFCSSQNQSEKLKIQFFSFGVILLLAPFFINKRKDDFSLSSTEIQIEHCYETIKLIKGDSPYSEMEFKHFYTLYSCIVNLSMSNRKFEASEVDMIIQKPMETVSKNDLLTLLEKFLEIETIDSVNNNPFNQIFLLKIRLTLNRSQNRILSQLYILSQDLSKHDGNNKTYFFQLFNQIIQKFGLFYESELQSTHVIDLNNMKEQFQTKVQYFLQKMDAFWQNMSNQQILISSLDNDLYEALNAMKQLELLFKKLQSKSKGQFDKEQKIIELSRILLNSYLEDRKAGNEIKKCSQKLEQQTNLSFMILDDYKIKFISQELIKEMAHKRVSPYQNQHMEVFFGQEFSPIIQKIIQNITVQSQKQWQTIPLSLTLGMVEIRKIKVVWVPSFQSRNKIMIKFATDIEVLRDSLLIYNYKTDTIGYFNSNFITRFNIDSQKIINHTKQSQVSFNEIFVNVEASPDMIKTTISSQNSIRCNIYLKKFTLYGSPEPMPVQIKGFRLSTFDDKSDYCVLKVIKLKNKKYAIERQNTATTSTDQKTLTQAQTDIKNQKHNDIEHELTKQYAHQQFFCKIPNNYETKITEKQSQLEQTQRWSYRYLISILFALIIAAIFVFWTLDSNLMKTRISNYTKEMNAIENTSEQYTLLYQAYSIALSRYYLQNHLLNYFEPGSLSWAQVDAAYVQKQQQALDQFLIRYLDQINLQPNSPIDYNIDFQHFSIKTNTKKTTLMDYAEHIKRHISDSNITFLLKNYDNLRNLTINYENAFINQQATSDIIRLTQNFEEIMMGAISFCLILVIAIALKIQHTINIMYTIMNEIELGTIKQCVKKMSMQKRHIISIFKKNSFQFKKSQNPKSLKYSLSQRSENSQQVQSFYSKQYKTQVTQQISRNTERPSFEKEKANSYQQFSSKDLKSSNSLDSDASSLRLKVVKADPEKRIGDEAFLSKVIRKLFFIFLLVGFNLVFYYDYTRLTTQKGGMMQLFEMKQKFYVALLHVKRSEVDAPILPTARHFFNKSVADPYHDEQVSLVAPIPSQIIMEEMREFGNQAATILSSDMCKFKGSELVGSVKPCEKYLKGAVVRGFKQSYAMYLRNGGIVGSQELQQFSSSPCTQQACSPYQQHIASSTLMEQTMRKMIQAFNLRVQQAFEQMLERAKRMSIIKCGVLLGIIALYYFYYKQLKRKCMLAVRYFTIIPKSVMCTMRITTFLRKNNVLEMLDIL